MLNKPSVKISIALVVIGIICASLTPSVLRKIAATLVVDTIQNKKIKPELIIVPSGSRGSRVKKAITLYQELSCPLLMSGGELLHKSEAEFMKDYAVLNGIPEKDVWVEKEAQSTWENATKTLAIVEEKNIKHIVITTSKFHTRRTYETFKKVYKGKDIKIDITGSDDGINYETWWRNPQHKKTVLLEWAKIVWYKIHYR